MNNRNQSWLAWGASWVGSIAETTGAIADVTYNVTLRDYNVDQIDEVSDSIEDLMTNAKKEANNAAPASNPTEHDIYVNLRPQLLQAIDNTLTRAGDIRNEDFATWTGMVNAVGGQLMHPIALAMIVAGGGLIYDELAKQVNMNRKIQNPNATDISISEASTEEILSTSLVTEMIKDPYVLELISIKKDDFKKYLSNNKVNLSAYISAMGKSTDDQELDNTSEPQSSFNPIQIALANPKAISSILQLIIDAQPELSDILQDDDAAKAIKNLTGVKASTLIDKVIPNAGQMLVKVFGDLKNDTDFAEFLESNSNDIAQALSGKNSSIDVLQIILSHPKAINSVLGSLAQSQDELTELLQDDEISKRVKTATGFDAKTLSESLIPKGVLILKKAFSALEVDNEFNKFIKNNNTSLAKAIIGEKNSTGLTKLLLSNPKAVNVVLKSLIDSKDDLTELLSNPEVELILENSLAMDDSDVKTVVQTAIPNLLPIFQKLFNKYQSDDKFNAFLLENANYLSGENLSTNFTQILLENPEVTSNILDELMDSSSELNALASDPKMAKIIKEKTGMDPKFLFENVIPSGGKIAKELLNNIDGKKLFASFMSDNYEVLDKFIRAQYGEDVDITENEFINLMGSVHDILRISKLGEVIGSNIDEFESIAIPYIESFKSDYLKDLKIQNTNSNELSEFGRGIVNLTGKFIGVTFGDGALTEEGREKFTKVIRDFTCGLNDSDIMGSTRSLLDFISVRLSQDEGISDQYEKFMRDHKDDAINAIDILLENNRWAQGQSTAIYNLIKDRKHLGGLLELYDDFEKNNWGGVFKSLLTNGDLRALVINAAIEGVKYFFREAIYPNSFRRAILNKFANNQLNVAVEHTLGNESNDQRVDLGANLLEADLDNESFKGFKHSLCFNRSFKGLLIKHDLENLTIDGFNFSETEFKQELKINIDDKNSVTLKDKSLTIKNCKVTNTTFERTVASHLKIVDSTIDPNTLLSLMPLIKEIGLDNTEFENINVEILYSSKKQIQSLEREFAEFGTIGTKIFKDYISPGESGRAK